MLNLIYSFLSFALTFLIVKLLINKFKNLLLDKPNERSSHKRPTPTAGGISFVIVGIFFTLLLGERIFLFCAPLALAGFLDDKYSLPNLFRYLIHLITASLLVFYYQNNILNLSLNSFDSIWILLLLIFIGTALINFSNFMDGIDGLVISIFLIANLAFVLNNNLNILPFVFSLLAFLIWNWPPAKIFMGDIGSTFLGATFFGLLFQTNNIYQAISLLLILTPLLADSSICVIRRFISGHNIFTPHKLHVYQRLNQAGWSHLKVTRLYASGSFILALAYLTNIFYLSLLGSLIVVLVGFYINKNHTRKFYYM